jgi:aspartate aminotransferase
LEPVSLTSTPPPTIIAAAIEALNTGKTRYTESAGILELREAIAAKLMVDNNVQYEPSQISVNCGAKHSCYNAILACVNPGDEVIIPAPYWTSYPEMVRLVGGIPVIVETKRENGWKLTPDEFEDAMSPMTKMIILNSPGNPTGSVYTKAELTALAEIAVGEGILILSDEIYEKLVYGGHEHVSIASFSKDIYDHTITINGFSKAYAMTGWRLGYTAAPKKIADAIDTIQSHTTSNPTTFAQYGALAALQMDQQIVSDMRDEFDVRRQYMLGRLSGIKNVRVVEPMGAFYFLVDIEPMQHQERELLREAAQQAARGRRSRPGLRCRAHHPLQLRHRPRCHQRRHGPLRRVLLPALISEPPSTTASHRHQPSTAQEHGHLQQHRRNRRHALRW